MSVQGFEPAPAAAVMRGEYECGRFGTPFTHVNLLDVEKPFLYPLPRFIKAWRLKEWRAFQFGDARWFFFTALYDAKTASIAVFNAYDRERKRRVGFQTPLLGSAFSYGERLSGSKTLHRSSRSYLEYGFEYDSGFFSIAVQRRERDSARSFAGEFRFSCVPKAAAPQAVCLPLGLNRAMYSTKMLMPFEGEFTSGGEIAGFSGPAAMGIIDDHKGFYPYRLRYDKVAGFGLDKRNRRVGFNLTDNQVRDQGKYNENCLWINNRIWPLPPVKVTRPRGPADEWVIQDTEGLVDLVFVPELQNDLRFNYGFIEADYHGPFGSFRGLLKNGDGDKVQAELLYGMGEQKYLRA